MGQGTGDACNCWVIGSDNMTAAYQDKAHRWKIPSPVPNESITLTLKAFIDNINLFISQTPEVSKTEFHTRAQQDIIRWHIILKAMGGKLNTKKCFWLDFHLQYDTKGNLAIRPKTPNDPKLVLTNPDSTHEILCSTQSNEGI